MCAEVIDDEEEVFEPLGPNGRICQYAADNGYHDWCCIGSAPDGTTFYKARCCGLESEGM